MHQAMKKKVEHVKIRHNASSAGREFDSTKMRRLKQWTDVSGLDRAAAFCAVPCALPGLEDPLSSQGEGSSAGEDVWVRDLLTIGIRSYSMSCLVSESS